MATQSSILAWRIPWTEEPGGSQSVGSQKSQTRLDTPSHIQLAEIPAQPQRATFSRNHHLVAHSLRLCEGLEGVWMDVICFFFFLAAL